MQPAAKYTCKPLKVASEVRNSAITTEQVSAVARLAYTGETVHAQQRCVAAGRGDSITSGFNDQNGVSCPRPREACQLPRGETPLQRVSLTPLATQYPQEAGRALIHPCRLQHMSLAVTEGESLNLIMLVSLLDNFPRFAELSQSVQLNVLSFLDCMGDLLAVRCCSKALNQTTKSDQLWRVPLAYLQQAIEAQQAGELSINDKSDDDPLAVDRSRKWEANPVEPDPHFPHIIGLRPRHYVPHDEAKEIALVEPRARAWLATHREENCEQTFKASCLALRTASVTSMSVCRRWCLSCEWSDSNTFSAEPTFALRTAGASAMHSPVATLTFADFSGDLPLRRTSTAIPVRASVCRRVLIKPHRRKPRGSPTVTACSCDPIRTTSSKRCVHGLVDSRKTPQRVEQCPDLHGSEKATRGRRVRIERQSNARTLRKRIWERTNGLQLNANNVIKRTGSIRHTTQPSA